VSQNISYQELNMAIVEITYSSIVRTKHREKLVIHANANANGIAIQSVLPA